MNESSALSRVEATLLTLSTAAVAVSGGVDSMTLATLAHNIMGRQVTMHHAMSPAVPADATERVRNLAASRGWQLDLFDAGEFADPNYRANPVNRCFFCKSNLYGAIARRTDAQILSGTNLDDLSEYRPGLDAAGAQHVRHPFVEANIDKPTVRSLAAELGLGGIAELPAAPCLASRVETGLRIEPAMLAMIDRTEHIVRDVLKPRIVRCRVRGSGVVIELDAATLAGLDEAARAQLRERLADTADTAPPVAFAAYRVGSAFLR